MITDGMIYFLAAPRLWPKPLRRLYVVTFPVSIPLQLAALLIAAVMGLIEGAVRALVNLWRLP